MANTASAKKATRKIARRTIVNKSRRTQMRGAVRIVEEAIKSGDREAALKAMVRAEPELMQAAQRNIILAVVAPDRQAREISRAKIFETTEPGTCRAFSLRGFNSSSVCILVSLRVPPGSALFPSPVVVPAESGGPCAMQETAGGQG